MSTQAPETPMNSFHAVHFYQDDGSLCRLVAEFLGAGLTAGEPALAFATPGHRSEIIRELSARSFDVDRLSGEGRLMIADAEQTLSGIVVDGEVLAQAFRQQVSGLIERARGGNSQRVVRIFGEMVDVLWRNSQHQAAVRLETLWNQMATTHGFSLLCSYSIGYFHKDASRDSVCCTHSHIMGEDGELGAIGAVQATVEAV